MNAAMQCSTIPLVLMATTTIPGHAGASKQAIIYARDQTLESSTWAGEIAQW